MANALGTNMGGLPLSQRASIVPASKTAYKEQKDEEQLQPLYQTMLAEGEAEAGLKELESKKKAAEETAAARTIKTAIESRGEFPESEQLTQAIQARNKAFVPTQETAGDLSKMFTLTTVIGFLLGGAGKGHAQQALSAMNGMVEGHIKGRDDLYKKEKEIYDENAKALDRMVDQLQKKQTSWLEMAKTNVEAARQQAVIDAHAAGAPFLADIAEKQGAVAAAKQARELAKLIETRRSHLETAEGKLRDQVIRQETLEERKREDRVRDQIAQDRLAITQQLSELKGNQVRQQQFVAQRVVNGLGGVASATEAIMQLPAGTTAGILPNLQTRDGMINYMRNSAGRTMSSSEAKALETLFTGVTRNLAAIEASGAATGLVGLSTNIEKLIPRAGDSAKDVALKMADIRRIATENVTPMINSGILLPKQAEEAQRLIERIDKAIPFTTMDVVQSLQKGRQTMGEKGAEIAAGGQLPSGIPPGSKKIGKTPKGVDVYQAPDGTRHIPE